jgi:hypothetical protein
LASTIFPNDPTTMMLKGQTSIRHAKIASGALASRATLDGGLVTFAVERSTTRPDTE